MIALSGGQNSLLASFVTGKIQYAAVTTDFLSPVFGYMVSYGTQCNVSMKWNENFVNCRNFKYG